MRHLHFAFPNVGRTSVELRHFGCDRRGRFCWIRTNIRSIFDPSNQTKVTKFVDCMSEIRPKFEGNSERGGTRCRTSPESRVCASAWHTLVPTPDSGERCANRVRHLYLSIPNFGRNSDEIREICAKFGRNSERGNILPNFARITYSYQCAGTPRYQPVIRANVVQIVYVI